MRTDSTVASGSTFFVTDAAGAPSRPYDGFYHRDVRHLDRYELAADERTIETLDVLEPRPGERVVYGGSTLESGARRLHLRRTQVVTDGLFERISVTNLQSDPLSETFSLSVGSGFDDIFEIRDYVADLDRSPTATRVPDGVTFEYEADDEDFRRCTAVTFDVPFEWTPIRGEGRIDADIDIEMRLDPGETATITVAVTPYDPPAAVASAFETARDEVRRRAHEWLESTAGITCRSERKEAVVRQSAADLLTLTTDTEAGPLFAAGIPWFATAFGRDSLIAAYQALPLTADPAVGTLRYLADHQATAHDEFRDAEPGKIMHEIRHGELAARNEIPHSPYYGTVDATALFVVLLDETWRRTRDDDLVTDLWVPFERALDWVVNRRTDHFLEYPTDACDGGPLTHTAWKDSGDGIMHPDGSHPEGPLAVAEVQGYAYDAMCRAADLYRTFRGDEERAQTLEAEATALRAAFDRDFWLPDEQFYAVSLDGNGDPVPAVTTNPGHCLWSGLLPPERAEAVIDRFLAPEMFSGWGIRTLSADHPVYNPQSYHLGSVWPHDNSLIALGMARYGRRDAAAQVTDALFDAAIARGNDRLPELFAGFGRSRTHVPVEYGVACEPQAWAAAAPLACLHAVHGVDPDVRTVES